MRELDATAIEDIALGAAVLGSGGGGDPFIGKLMALQAVEECGPVRLLDADELDDGALCVPAAMMGAPTVMVEKIPNGAELVRAYRSLAAFLGHDVSCVAPIEAGGVNSMIPLALAARLGLPVADGDGMGRAFPELQMVTFHLDAIRATPMVVADEKGNDVLLRTVDNLWTERIARVVTVQMGGAAMIALYAMSGTQFKRSAIRGTLTLAERIGRALRDRQPGLGPVEALLAAAGGGRILFHGKIVDIERRTSGGFVRGTVLVSGVDECAGHVVEVRFQNENLAALSGGRVIASVPDLIVLLDRETARPITTEGLRYGYRVVVVGLPCAARWRLPDGLATVGPAYFGYDDAYVPLEATRLPWQE